MGLLGLDPGVRNGFQQIKVSFTLRGDDPDAAPARRRAVPCPIGRVRHHHQRCAGVDRGRRRPAMSIDTDVVIVGARAAGASTAMLAARAGLSVVLLDRDRPDADTLSTHALMRGGVLQLARWNLLEQIVAADTPAIRHTTFHYTHDDVTLSIKPSAGVEALYAPRRTLLDPILVDAARAAGAVVRHNTTVVGLDRDDHGRVTGVEIRGPDGQIVHRACPARRRRRRPPVDDRSAGGGAADTMPPTTPVPSSTATGPTSTPAATSGPTGPAPPQGSSRPTTVKRACSPAGCRPASVEAGTPPSGPSSSRPRRTWPSGCEPRSPHQRRGPSSGSPVTSVSHGGTAGRSSETPDHGRTRSAPTA